MSSGGGRIIRRETLVASSKVVTNREWGRKPDEALEGG